MTSFTRFSKLGLQECFVFSFQKMASTVVGRKGRRLYWRKADSNNKNYLKKKYQFSLTLIK